MKLGYKIGIFTTLAAGLGLYLYGRIAGIKNFVNNLVITPKWYGGINDMEIDPNRGIKLPLAIDIENRSDEEMKIRINSMTANSKDGSSFASSKAGNYEALVKKQRKTTIPIDVWIEATPVYKILVTGLINLSNGNSFGFENKVSAIVKDASMRINLSAKGVTFDIIIDFGQSKKVEDSRLSGLGLVSYAERKIQPLSDYQHLLPENFEMDLTYEDPIIASNITPEETARFVRKMAYEYRRDTKMLSEALLKPTVKDTVKSIWDFCVNHIKYEMDSLDNEQVRRPLRTLLDQRADCDCYSALIASMCENLNLNYQLRIAEYDHKGYYQHIYVIIEGYVCDPVVDRCFYEKPTTKHKDF